MTQLEQFPEDVRPLLAEISDELERIFSIDEPARNIQELKSAFLPLTKLLNRLMFDYRCEDN